MKSIKKWRSSLSVCVEWRIWEYNLYKRTEKGCMTVESITDKYVGLSWRVATYFSCDYAKIVIFKRTGRTQNNYFLGEENEIQTLIFEQSLKFQGPWLSWNITINKKDKSDFITFQTYFKDTLCEEIYIPKYQKYDDLRKVFRYTLFKIKCS